MPYPAIGFVLLVTFGIPLGALVVFAAKRQGLVKPFLLGAATLAVFQLATRLPLLALLQSQAWFAFFSVQHPAVYSLALGLSAALFEEAGRYIVMRLFMGKTTAWRFGVAHGLGHGGIEALLLVGLSYLVVLFSNPGVLVLAGPAQIFLAGLERLFTLVIHTGLSVMVLQSLRKKSPWPLVCAILVHTALDAPLGLFTLAGLGVYAIEAFVGLFALGLLVYIAVVGTLEKKETESAPHENNPL
ncbi:MAG: YhfC family glutamic-type intramembrane protease [Oscillospiraceae bacterium]